MVACGTCGTENRGGARFCDSCGASLAAAEAPREQRKTVTVLFCDVLGSTARGERLDPEATRAVMARYFETARAAVERHGGTVEKFIGDAVMAVFGVPQVHEDDALRAVRAAVELRDAVEIDVRIGVNTGQVVTGTGDTLVTGDAVNVAARLEQAAAPGEVLMGADTYALVRHAVDAELLPPLKARGKAEPVTAYRLAAIIGEEAHVPRFDALFVGRSRETRLLADAWDRVRSERACALFTILGTAGVGKSRLAQEFLAGIDGGVVTGRCLSYGEGITYWPVVEVVKQLLGSDPPPNPGVAALLRREQATTDDIAAGVRRLLEASAAERPLVVLFDDVHWGEPAFLDLVEHVADWSRDAPLLVICLARPELLDRRPGWSGGKLNTTTVLLEPLDGEETAKLIAGLAGGGSLDPALSDRITVAAGGNPLFVEEMLAMVGEHGSGEIAVPPTIQALLAARLDQLPRVEREALERGSVEGQVFHRGAVQALASGEAAVSNHLLGLVRKELVRPSPPMLPDDEAFRFRHLLIRDAAYEALPKAVRAELHERFADWISTRGSELVELDEILGYHLEQAAGYLAELDRSSPELARRASAHLAAAGTRAHLRADHHAAVTLLGRATNLLEPDDPERVRLQPTVAEAVYGAGDVVAGRALLEQAAEQADTQGQSDTAAHARVMSIFIRGHMGEEPVADSLARLEAVMAALPPETSHDVLVRAHVTRGWFVYWLGRCAEALADGRRALEYLQRDPSWGWEDEVTGLMSASMMQGPTPWPEFERFADERLAAVPERYGGRLGSNLQHHLPLARAARGDVDAARAEYAAIREAWAERRTGIAELSVAPHAAEVELLAGDFATAERILREAWIGLAEAGEQGYRSTIGTKLAEVLARLERLDEAELVADEAERIASDDDFLTLVGARRARALVALGRGRHEEAVTAAAEALRIADRSDYAETRIHARIALGEALIVAGRGDEAVPPLREAITLADAKGSVVLAARARSFLADGVPASTS
jgi:class 3 adenylate cyclase/tetratricopeptide (TPR) repeat protein